MATAKVWLCGLVGGDTGGAGLPGRRLVEQRMDRAGAVPDDRRLGDEARSTSSRIRCARPTSLLHRSLHIFEVRPNLCRRGRANTAKRTRPLHRAERAAATNMPAPFALNFLTAKMTRTDRNDDQRRAPGGDIKNVGRHAEDHRQLAQSATPSAAAQYSRTVKNKQAENAGDEFAALRGCVFDQHVVPMQRNERKPGNEFGKQRLLREAQRKKRQ